MPHLIFLDERFSGRSYELTCERTTVGRGSENTLTIRDNSLSREHCEILTYASEVIVRDLGSRNGTFIDGVRLSGAQSQVKHGQVISFGSVKARLVIEYAEEEMNESTAFHEFLKFRKQADQPAPVEAIHMTFPANGSSINETIQLKATNISKTADAAPLAEPSPTADFPRSFRAPWLALIIVLLVLLVVALLR